MPHPTCVYVYVYVYVYVDIIYVYISHLYALVCHPKRIIYIHMYI
jgi:hypothetical protein